MISKHCKCFCKELEKIENYDKATADTTQTEEEHQKRKATFAKIKEAYANRQDKSITWNEFQKIYKENK